MFFFFFFFNRWTNICIFWSDPGIDCFADMIANVAAAMTLLVENTFQTSEFFIPTSEKVKLLLHINASYATHPFFQYNVACLLK